jgi:hypothetical protein
MIALATPDPLLERFVRELHGGDPLSTPDLSAHPAADRTAARLAWANRIVDEYRSVAVFGELLILLAELEAPYPALCALHHLIGDELRHAHVSATVVGWLGGTADLSIDLADLALPPRPPSESRGRRALLIIARELVVAEEESVVVLAACRDATTQPRIRAVLSALLRDEARHAATGRALLRLLAPTVDAADRDDLDAVMAADRADLRARYRAAATGGPGRALGASVTIADLDALAVRRRLPVPADELAAAPP